MKQTPEECETYLEHLADDVGHPDRQQDLRRPMMMPTRECTEPIAARFDPQQASAIYPSLHHFVAKVQRSNVTANSASGAGMWSGSARGRRRSAPHRPLLKLSGDRHDDGWFVDRLEVRTVLNDIEFMRSFTDSDPSDLPFETP